MIAPDRKSLYQAENPEVTVIGLLIRQGVKGDLSNIVCADKGDISILSGGKDLIQLAYSKCIARFEQILYVRRVVLAT
jgi:hypothetical protein